MFKTRRKHQRITSLIVFYNTNALNPITVNGVSPHPLPTGRQASLSPGDCVAITGRGQASSFRSFRIAGICRVLVKFFFSWRGRARGGGGGGGEIGLLRTCSRDTGGKKPFRVFAPSRMFEVCCQV